MERTRKKILVVALVVVILFTATPVISTPAKSSGSVKIIKVTNIKNKKLNLVVGQTKQIHVKVTVKGKISKKVTFQSMNKKVATVTPKGKIKAKKAGTTKITITSKANRKKRVVIRIKVAKKKTPAKVQKEEITKPIILPIKPQETTAAPQETTVAPQETTTVPMLEQEESGMGADEEFGKLF